MAKPKSLPYEAPESAESYSVTLHFQGGGSDKIYKLAIEPAGDLWVVNYANGRRGGTLTQAPVTKAPVSYAEARKQCNAKLFSKVGDGYLPIEGSRFGDGMTAEAIATVARESSGVVPQLVNVAGESAIEHLIEDNAWVAQLKYNGDRRIVIVEAGKAIGGNRRGQTVALSKPIADCALSLGHDLKLDGEQIGDTFHCWDILELDGKDLRGLPLFGRSDILADLLENLPENSAIAQVRTAIGAASKRQLLEYAKANNLEGVVFKRSDATYEPGRPNSGGSWLKHKLWYSLSAIVEKVNSQRSVALQLIEADGTPISVGNVTIPSNHAIPAEGEVIEVRYMHAFDGGSLFQPTYLGKRNDIAPAECLASQRVFEGRLEVGPVGLAM